MCFVVLHIYGNKYIIYALTPLGLNYKGPGAWVCPSISPETDLPNNSTRFLTTSVSSLRMISSEVSLGFAASRSSSAGMGSPKVIDRSVPARGMKLKGNFRPSGISWSNPVNQTGMTVGCEFASMMILPLTKERRMLSDGQPGDEGWEAAHSPLEAP